MKKEIKVAVGSSENEIKRREEFLDKFKNYPIPDSEVLQNLEERQH